MGAPGAKKWSKRNYYRGKGGDQTILRYCGERKRQLSLAKGKEAPKKRDLLKPRNQ